MTEISAVTPTTPEPPKAPEHKHTREQVITAFNDTFDDFRFSRQPLTPQDEAVVTRIQTAKEKTIDKGKSRVQNKFSNEQTGEQFVTLEGVPIDRLLGYLKTRIESGLLTPEEMTTYKERWDILNSHKRPFLQGKQLNPSIRVARNQQEAALMSQTVADISGEAGFWNMAEVELSGRFELVLPPKTKAEDVTPPPPPEPPTEVLPPETITPPPLPPEPPIVPPTETPPPQPPTVNNVRYEVAIVNRTADISKRAREVAEELLREKLKGRNIFRRIKYRVAEEYYRQKFTQQAYRAMLEHGNSYLTMESVGSSLRVLNADAGRSNEREAGSANIESIRTRLRERMGSQGIRIAEGPLRQQLIESIIQPVINGTITEPQQVQRALTEFISAHSGDPVIAQLFGNDSNAWGQASEYFATDLLDVGRAIQADYNAHGQSMEWLDQHLDIQLASPQWAASTENQKLSRTDKFIKWAQKRRLTGAIFNPAVVGAMSSIGTFAILRAPMRVASTAASLAAPGAGALSGGLFAAFRRNYDLKVDRNAHQVERAYGMQIPAGSKQRERLERFSYDTASVTDLINGGGVDRQRNNDPRRSVVELVASDLTVESNQQDLVSRMAEIEARLEYSAINKVDLITFQSRETVEQGRLALLKVIVDGRAALRNAGVDESRIAVMSASLVHHFETDQADRDRAFKRFRLRSSLANGAFGSVAGMASGLVVQEGVALGMRATGHGVGQTFLEKAVGYEGSAPRTTSTPVDTFRDLAGRGGSYDATSELRFNIDSTNHTVQITDIADGRSVTDAPISIGADGRMIFEGNMPQDLQDRLTEAHFDILDKSGPPTTTTEIVSGPQATEDWRRLGTKYDQQQWYRNDTPGIYELNEHRAYTIKQGDTLVLDMSRMQLGTESGLYPNPIDVQNVIQSKEAGFSFKIPGGGNHQSIWIPESADGVADGLLHLDPNDTVHMVTMGDGSKMSIGELSKMLVNQEELAKYNDGDIGTEFNNRREVFRLGANGRRGWWEVGRVTDQNGQRVLQTFATGRGASDAVGVNIIEVPGKALFEIIPPKSTLVTFTPFESIPVIPIPFAPRHPLERLLFTYGYGGEYGRNNYGLLNESDYPNRFSSRILNNPDAILDEDEEVKDYLSKQKPEYLRELTAMNAQISTPMSPSTRVVVAIPAYGEGANIQKLLNSFLGQVDKDGNPINPDVFEIMILENHPDSVSKDSTEKEIRLFTTANPTIRVSYAHKVWKSGEAAVGHARKIANDLALLRSQQRTSSDGDLILVSQDADVEGIDKRYIHSLISDFDESPELDAVAGKWNLPDSTLAKPNVRAAQRLWYMLDRVIARDAEGPTVDREPHLPGLVGRNSAFKASVYAAVGGYNPTARLAEDLEIGWLIGRARNWEPQRVKYDNTAEVVSNPRRFIAAVAQGIPLIQMYGNFHENTSVRSMDNAAVLSLIPDNFSMAMFQKEIDALWSSHQSGQYAHLGIRFEPLLLRTLGMMGVEAKVENGKVKIVSADKMIKGLEKFDKSKSKAKKGPTPTVPPTIPPPTPVPTGTETSPPTGTRPRIPTETTPTSESSPPITTVESTVDLGERIDESSQAFLSDLGNIPYEDIGRELPINDKRPKKPESFFLPFNAEDIFSENDKVSLSGRVIMDVYSDLIDRVDKIPRSAARADQLIKEFKDGMNDYPKYIESQNLHRRTNGKSEIAAYNERSKSEACFNFNGDTTISGFNYYFNKPWVQWKNSQAPIVRAYITLPLHQLQQIQRSFVDISTELYDEGIDFNAKAASQAGAAERTDNMVFYISSVDASKAAEIIKRIIANKGIGKGTVSAARPSVQDGLSWALEPSPEQLRLWQEISGSSQRTSFNLFAAAMAMPVYLERLAQAHEKLGNMAEANEFRREAQRVKAIIERKPTS